MDERKKKEQIGKNRAIINENWGKIRFKEIKVAVRENEIRNNRERLDQRTSEEIANQKKRVSDLQLAISQEQSGINQEKDLDKIIRQQDAVIKRQSEILSFHQEQILALLENTEEQRKRKQLDLGGIAPKKEGNEKEEEEEKEPPKPEEQIKPDEPAAEETGVTFNKEGAYPEVEITDDEMAAEEPKITWQEQIAQAPTAESPEPQEEYDSGDEMAEERPKISWQEQINQQTPLPKRPPETKKEPENLETGVNFNKEDFYPVPEIVDDKMVAETPEPTWQEQISEPTLIPESQVEIAVPPQQTEFLQPTQLASPPHEEPNRSQSSFSVPSFRTPQRKTLSKEERELLLKRLKKTKKVLKGSGKAIRRVAFNAARAGAQAIAEFAAANPEVVIIAAIIIGVILMFFMFFMGGGGGRGGQLAYPSPSPTPPGGYTPIPKLTLNKTGPNHVDNGRDIEYSIDATYTGNQELILTDIIPQNASFVSATGIYQSGPGNVVWKLKDNPFPTSTDGSTKYTFKITLHPTSNDIVVTNKAYAEPVATPPNPNANDFESIMTGQGRNTNVLGDRNSFISTIINKSSGHFDVQGKQDYIGSIYDAALSKNINPLAVFVMWGVEESFQSQGTEYNCPKYGNGFNNQLKCAVETLDFWMKDFDNAKKRDDGGVVIPKIGGGECVYYDPFVYAYEWYTPNCHAHDHNEDARPNFYSFYKTILGL